MPSSYKPYIPQTTSELIDMLGMMMLSSPTFLDNTGYFPERNIYTVFSDLNESLKLLNGKLGGERYRQLREMSDCMRKYFETDEGDRVENTVKGREIIREMQTLLKAKK